MICALFSGVANLSGRRHALGAESVIQRMSRNWTSGFSVVSCTSIRTRFLGVANPLGRRHAPWVVSMCKNKSGKKAAGVTIVARVVMTPVRKESPGIVRMR